MTAFLVCLFFNLFIIFSDNELSVCAPVHAVWGMGADEVITATDSLQRSIDKAQNTSKVMTNHKNALFMYLSVYLKPVKTLLEIVKMHV